MARGRFEPLDIPGLGGGGEADERVAEPVYFPARFSLGGLDQHGPMHHQGEIHGHGMEAEVDHRLGEIERRDARSLKPGVVKKGLVHAWPLWESRAHHA